MIITRCQDQKPQTLEAFYTELSQSAPIHQEGSNAMLGLIARLRALPGSRRVYGLTSHSRLCLLAEDCSKSPWFVIISALDKSNYTVEYLMPDRIAPWPHAFVSGEARSEDKAVELILTAMEQSEGWRGD